MKYLQNFNSQRWLSVEVKIPFYSFRFSGSKCGSLCGRWRWKFLVCSFPSNFQKQFFHHDFHISTSFITTIWAMINSSVTFSPTPSPSECRIIFIVLRYFSPMPGPGAHAFFPLRSEHNTFYICSQYVPLCLARREPTRTPLTVAIDIVTFFHATHTPPTDTQMPAGVGRHGGPNGAEMK